jgi:hypothetical protein
MFNVGQTPGMVDYVSVKGKQGTTYMTMNQSFAGKVTIKADSLEKIDASMKIVGEAYEETYLQAEIEARNASEAGNENDRIAAWRRNWVEEIRNKCQHLLQEGVSFC